MSVYKPGVYLMIEKNVHWKHTDPVHHPENHKTRSPKSILKKSGIHSLAELKTAHLKVRLILKVILKRE